MGMASIWCKLCVPPEMWIQMLLHHKFSWMSPKYISVYVDPHYLENREQCRYDSVKSINLCEYILFVVWFVIQRYPQARNGERLGRITCEWFYLTQALCYSTDLTGLILGVDYLNPGLVCTDGFAADLTFGGLRHTVLWQATIDEN